jgi:RimJ/RimL family protein N-acetyltransferase
MPLPIETERLILRKYDEKDLLDILEYSSHPDFWTSRNLDWEPTEEGIRNYWEMQGVIEPEADPEWMALVIELKEQERVIGNTGIGVIHSYGANRQGTIGWLLGVAYRGLGYATEAAKALLAFGFTEMRLHRIIARTGRDNIRSWHLMERIGMVREAHFRQSHIVNGEWRDEFIYAILAEEWRGKTEE